MKVLLLYDYPPPPGGLATQGELLRRGYDVYMTLVDDQQIDCVIRQEKNGKLRYLDVQIKARSENAKNPGTFSAMEIRQPRENFIYIFYSVNFV